MKYLNDNSQWALNKGLKRWCQEHQVFYDTRTGCPECLKRQRQEEKERRKKAKEARKKTWDENAAKTVWPDGRPPELGKKKKRWWWPF